MLIQKLPFILVFFCIRVFADPSNSGVIILRDSVKVKVQVLDTTGCTVVFINSNGAKVALKKNRINTLECNSKIIDYSLFQCTSGNTAPVGMLEQDPREELMSALMKLPKKKQETVFDSTVYYCRRPLCEISLESEFDTASVLFLQLFRNMATSELPYKEAINKVSGSVSQHSYLAVCFSIREKEKEDSDWKNTAPFTEPPHQLPTHAQVTPNGLVTLPSPAPTSNVFTMRTQVPIKELGLWVRVIIVSLKSKCIIFDEDVYTPETHIRNELSAQPSFIAKQGLLHTRAQAISDGFAGIQRRMLWQGLIEN
jgi:hypothetical protein